MASNHEQQDTIAAISTPSGTGGIAIVRMSGPLSTDIVRSVFSGHDPSAHPRVMLHGYIRDDGADLDEVLVCSMPAPHSYTTEDVVEIHCHGGRVSARTVLDLLTRSCARLAEPGEFTRRAFLGGRIDLIQAEAVMEMITAGSRAALRNAERLLHGDFSHRIEDILGHITHARAGIETSIDFLHDDTESQSRKDILTDVDAARTAVSAMLASHASARRVHDGVAVVIAGKVNSGKSSLFNALLGRSRAIVTPTPGTTRDWIEEQIECGGYPVNLIDTAGIRDTEDAVERHGVSASKRLLSQADIVLTVTDTSSDTFTEVHPLAEEVPDCPHIRVYTKIDLVPGLTPPDDGFPVSSITGTGIDALRTQLEATARERCISADIDTPVFLERHHAALKSVDAALAATVATLAEGSDDTAALELADAALVLSGLLGKTAGPDVLDSIFREFCIGK
jgi:tRNA modification GTPase